MLWNLLAYAKLKNKNCLRFWMNWLAQFIVVLNTLARISIWTYIEWIENMSIVLHVLSNESWSNIILQCVDHSFIFLHFVSSKNSMHMHIIMKYNSWLCSMSGFLCAIVCCCCFLLYFLSNLTRSCFQQFFLSWKNWIDERSKWIIYTLTCHTYFSIIC